MNAIYINCWSDPWVKVAKKLDTELNIHPVLWIGYSSWTSSDNADIIVPKEFPDIKYMDFLEAWKGLFPKEILNSYPDYYINVDFLKKHADHELQAIKMMERVDPDRYSFNFMERQRHFRNMIKQWQATIDILKPDVVISTAIPHRLYDYVLFWLCKEYQIPFIMFEHTQFDGRFYNLKDYFYTLKDLFIKDWHKFEKESNVIDLIPEDIKNRFFKVQGDYQTAAPDYMRFKNYIVKFDSTLKTIGLYIKRTLRGQYSFKSLFFEGKKKDVKRYYYVKNKKMTYENSHYSVFEQMIHYIKSNNYKKNLLNYYESLCIEPDLDVPYVCHFLHYQPEATTCPGGDIFVDQSLCVELLLKYLPDNYIIYIKEHKHQFLYNRPGQSCRMKDLYDDFLKNPRVKLISTDYNTFDLIDHSKAVSTITGTVGWEAMVRHKPVIVFGLCWFENYSSGVLRITDERSAENMLQFIEDYQYNENSLLAYLAAVGKNTSRAYYFKASHKDSLNLSEEECVNNIASAIINKINERTNS